MSYEQRTAAAVRHAMKMERREQTKRAVMFVAVLAVVAVAVLGLGTWLVSQNDDGWVGNAETRASRDRLERMARD